MGAGRPWLRGARSHAEEGLSFGQPLRVPEGCLGQLVGVTTSRGPSLSGEDGLERLWMARLG